MNKEEQFSPDDEVEAEISAKGFLGFVSQLSFSAFADEELIAAIAAAVSKRNQLITDDDRAILAQQEGARFFEIQPILCKVIPLLEIEATELIELVKILVDLGGEDLAANQPNASFREWCKVDWRRSDEVIQLAKDGNKSARQHLVFALEAIGDFSEAINCLERSEEEQTAGVLALSRIKLDADQVLIALQKAVTLALEVSSKRSYGITRAVYDIAAQDENIERSVLLPILDKLFVSDEPYIVHLAATLLNWHQERMSEDEVQICLGKLASVDTKNKGTIDEIDMALAKLVQRGEIQRASSTAREIIDASNGSINDDALDSFFHKLIHGDSIKLAQLATEWLSFGGYYSCVALMRAITEIGRTEPVFSVDEIPLPETTNEQIFLCRKAIGYLFIHPMSAAAFLVAVLERGGEVAKQHARELLYDPLLLSHSGALLEWLGVYSHDNEASRLDITDVLKRANLVLEGFKEAREVVELEPSESARAFAKFQKMKEAEQAGDAEERRSVFASLVTTQYLLYGDRYACNVMTNAEELEQKIMPYSEISVSLELPKGIFIDPIGLDMMLNQFRHERIIS